MTHQPRWLAWCRATGRNPDLSAESIHVYLQFCAWVDARWAEWDALNARELDGLYSAEDNKAFNRWLTALAAAQGKGIEAERG